MIFRRIIQWPVFYAGLLLHAFSFWTIRSDPDTAYDWHRNLSLDLNDPNGDLSDGVREAWLRIKMPGRLLHDLKNYPREWCEVVHPKTTARVWGLTLLLTLIVGLIF